MLINRHISLSPSRAMLVDARQNFSERPFEIFVERTVMLLRYVLELGRIALVLSREPLGKQPCDPYPS